MSVVAADRSIADPVVGVEVSFTVVACAWMIVVTSPTSATSRIRPPDTANRFPAAVCGRFAAARETLMPPAIVRTSWLLMRVDMDQTPVAGRFCGTRSEERRVGE